jgi:transcriptional regulator
MLRAIVCIEVPLTGLVGKYKLSQNRSAVDRAGVVANLQTDAAVAGEVGSAAAVELADWMLAAGLGRP